MDASKFVELQSSAPERVAVEYYSKSAPESIAENQKIAFQSVAAEYTHPAPEFNVDAHHNNAPESVPVSTLPEYDEKARYRFHAFDEDDPKEIVRKKRRYCGLGPRTVIALLLVTLVIVAGVAVGVPLGIKRSRQNQSVPTSPGPTQTFSPMISGSITSTSTRISITPTPTPTALEIKSAVYAAEDVTDVARQLSPRGSSLYIDMKEDTATVFNLPDTWYNVRKCLSLLHSYGESIRTFIACDAFGEFVLPPGDVSLSKNTQEIASHSPNSTDFKIVSVVWGPSEIRDRAVDQALYDYKNNGSAIPFENSFFGGTDALPDFENSGVVWYTEDNFKTFKSIFAREGESVAF
ncbi:hypothetical protein K458DRAFT_387798 [Lentithecium fluviatile CBS 122367]|uniref:Uncharacterized protein n=1 Tax=Lentithecium fluviatile CBS 122367 TaxID=1168545 RepID=A0A6G1J6I2_9PLEO|nr:hypothetical protein K458DRAFT_387798 [Lentithecium fluviatile CBS 122367]